MSDRALRRAMARDLHHAGVPGDLEAIADFLITRRGWTQAEPEGSLQPMLRPLIQNDAQNAVHIAIAGFTGEGAPVLGNIARTAAERVAEARARQHQRRENR